MQLSILVQRLLHRLTMTFIYWTGKLTIFYGYNPTLYPAILDILQLWTFTIFTVYKHLYLAVWPDTLVTVSAFSQFSRNRTRTNRWHVCNLLRFEAREGSFSKDLTQDGFNSNALFQYPNEILSIVFVEASGYIIMYSCSYQENLFVQYQVKFFKSKFFQYFDFF